MDTKKICLLEMLKRTRAQRKIYPNDTNIDQFPDSILLEIFRRLPRYAVLPATLVCRRWCVLINLSSLLDSFTLKVCPKKNEDLCLEYEYYLSRSERKYRKADVVIYGQHSFLVAVIALRRLGQHLTELKLTLDQCNYPTYFQRHFERMKELEMGLEEYEQMLWEQEVDSYDRCLRPIATPKEEDVLKQPEPEETIQEYRRIEEVFLSFVYRHCCGLQKLIIKQIRSHWDVRTKVLLYEGVEMEHLVELEVCGTGFMILADSPELKSLTVQGVTTGVSFYYGLRHAFPKLKQLEIVNDYLFDDQCLWAISRRCTQLEELSLSFIHSTVSQQAFRYIQRLKRLKKLSICLQGPYHHADFAFADWPKLKIEKLFITTDELRVDSIREILLRNENLVEFVVTTRRRIAYSTLHKLQQTRPTCELTYRQQCSI
ncbi:uncharacterized protein LOC131429034 [Malaya genurostris]|uniref:uncharacterized protein LOC131429034 n=1 Tax=Malaya genurostris TaxID=325434 RepID=UPI0026F3D8F2|nr:uncharacterized protein LOC131429034 [Malaya genurostris]